MQLEKKQFYFLMILSASIIIIVLGFFRNQYIPSRNIQLFSKSPNNLKNEYVTNITPTPVKLRDLCDLNLDNKCDKEELEIFHKSLYKCVGNLHYEKKFDIDKDGCVDFTDQALMGLELPQ